MQNHQNRKPNRLIKEKSPYLLQHAYNPVDWYPWGKEAFSKAEDEDKPLFVSIGYSTCHWCHVMEKESFEDEQVASLLNEAFVCIKVDREERPDLDAAYMAVCQSMGRSCGWPLNVVMTPKKNPFFVTSYIPRDNRYGSVGMTDLVPQLLQIYRSRRSEMEALGVELKEQIASATTTASKKNELGKAELDEAFDQLFLAFDHENAGFGHAPKFPSPHHLLFLMRYYKRTTEKAAWSMVERTLRAMRRGGIFDQVGLGFNRYSTDQRWLVPHFEKMLYDQALLALAYLEAYQFSGQLKFKVSAKETLDYVLRDLAATEGGFYSAVDADSEGEEGKFYLWTKQEITKALTPDLVDFAVKIFDVRAEGNYMENMRRNGKNILHLALTPEQMATETNQTADQVIAKLAKTVNLLYAAREKRVHPAIDDKVLVDWNGLTVAALARASRVLGEKSYLHAAQRASDFILKQMQTSKGRLYHRYARGERAVLAFLDDYAFFVWGLVELYISDFDGRYLRAAEGLAKTMIADFWDNEKGGFFFTSEGGDLAVPKIKQTYDGAYPSGNSVALLDLLSLARLSGEVSFEQTAQKLLDAFAGDIKGYPMGHTMMLSGLDYEIGPSYSVVLAGEKDSVDINEMLAAIGRSYIPNLTVKLWTSEDAKSAPPGVSYEKIGDKATAYVCQNQTCMPPTNEVGKMLDYLRVAVATG